MVRLHQVQVKSAGAAYWSELGSFESEAAANAWIAEHSPSGAFEYQEVRVVTRDPDLAADVADALTPRALR